MKVKVSNKYESIKFQPVWYICHIDSRPLLEKSENITEHIKSKNIIFSKSCVLWRNKKRMKLVKLSVIFEVFRVSVLV